MHSVILAVTEGIQPVYLVKHQNMPPLPSHVAGKRPDMMDECYLVNCAVVSFDKHPKPLIQSNPGGILSVRGDGFLVTVLDVGIGTGYNLDVPVCFSQIE
jgi:hypothetical protein